MKRSIKNFDRNNALDRFKARRARQRRDLAVKIWAETQKKEKEETEKTVDKMKEIRYN